MKTYDSLMDQSPYVQRKTAEAEVQGAQKIVAGIVEARFPALAELAQQQVALIGSTEKLNQLAKLVVTAPDEASARWLLETFVD